MRGSKSGQRHKVEQARAVVDQALGDVVRASLEGSVTSKRSSERTFPFIPKSSRDLQLGDFWAVRLSDGRFGCAIVTDLKPSGVASRKSLVAGLVDWVGVSPPTHDAATGEIFAQGLTGIEAISATGSKILGNVPLPKDFVFAPNFRGPSVGSLHHVWGWKTLPRSIEEHLARRK
jgi:hypothetical protein